MPGTSTKKSGKKTSTNKHVASLAETGRDQQQTCPVVGICASAGGLSAFKAFLGRLPVDSDMAFVLVPHLDPAHQSLMVELLSRQTEMPVCEITDHMQVLPNHVYIIPPAKYLVIKNSILQLENPPKKKKIETAIDYFLRSLAIDLEERAIGIILSGTSSHGTSGLQAIKASGGMTMAQSPDSAEYDSMPQNAIDSGIVDYILVPEDMPATIIKYVQHAYVSGIWQPPSSEHNEVKQLNKILKLLRVQTSYDFRHYRKNMIKRRVMRRLGVNHIENLVDYADLLSKSSREGRQLLRDLLIGVTFFFREPKAFRELEKTVIARWLEQDNCDEPIRIWVPGCATGEEAYSIAILLIENFSEAQQPLRFQIFATDIDEEALDIARHGIYPISTASDISAERLSRFFNIQPDGRYQVNKQLRESIVFANQNLINDAPFSRLDMISCRNLLIYLETELQQKVITLFHFALNSDGYLLLGSSETVGRHLDLFQTVSKKWRIFRRIGPVRRDNVDFPITSLSDRRGQILPEVKSTIARDINFAELTQRQLLDDYTPAAVLINRKYEVLYFQGATGSFLEAPTGEPTRDLMALARQGLKTRLRAACYKAIREESSVTDHSPKLRVNDSWLHCSVTVKPLMEPKQAEGLLLVTFQLQQQTASDIPSTTTENSSQVESALVRQLEYELKVTREDLQSSIEDMNSSNEELKASNEEIMSMNEELQSANEELETSKEELQSLNEELTTVNSQLQDKLEELDKSHNDMTNLLNSSDIATLFLDIQLAIRQFTPSTGKLLGLISSDIGRLISTFATEFTGCSLQDDAHEVLDKLVPVETLINTADNCFYLRRVLPYRTSDNHINGLVVTFIDVTQRYKSDEQMRRMATVLHDSSDAISVVGFDGNIIAWNRGAEALYGYSEAQALKMNIRDLIPAQELAEEQQFLQRIENGEFIDSFDSTRVNKDGRRINVWVTTTPLYDKNGKPVSVATTERDISERRILDKLRVQTDRLMRMVEHLPAGAVYREGDNLIMNKAAEEITGYERDELSTVDVWFKRLYGEQADEKQRMYNQSRDAWFPETIHPIAHTRKNGERRYVEYAGYRFDDHEVWILHDVTQQQQFEAEIMDREQRLRAVMDNAAEAIIVIGQDGLVTDFNTSAVTLFGYSADEVVGHNVSMLMPSPYRESHDDYIANYLKKEKKGPTFINLPRELPGLRKDGDSFPLHLTVTEVASLGIFVGILRDLSEQKILEREVAEISTVEKERIGRELHDGLGQQLTGLSLIVSSIRQKYKNQGTTDIVGELDEVIKQLQLAIKDTRNISRGLVPISVSADGLVDALKLLVEDVNNMGVECHLQINEDEQHYSDRTSAMQIYRVIQEAVNNALKHANAKRIDIHLGSIHSSCRFYISDNGCGFNVEKQSNGMGTRIMVYRAGIIGCELDIESTPGTGTTVSCNQTAIGKISKL